MEQAPNKKERIKQSYRSEKPVKVFGVSVKRSDVIKLVGLVAFMAITAGIVAALWPSLSMFFEPGGPEKVVQSIQDMGMFGVVALLGLQFLQIIVAIIPGEVVEVAAGIIYGPLWGSLILWVGCIISSAVVFLLVHRLGAPFVRAMIPEKQMKRFAKFEAGGKLPIIVFVLFLLPAMPKDVFTYLVPLTNMKMRDFLILSNIGRLPALIVTTYAAAGIAGDDIFGGITVLVVALILCAICVVYRESILEKLAPSKPKK